jgi:iron-regulated transporter 1
VRRLGVLKGSLAFIALQAISVVAALPFFYSRTQDGLFFLVLILISRIGLYGFSMGEMEIRQRTIAVGQRGEINGVASALTSFATLILYGAGTRVEDHQQFSGMVILSVVSVCMAAGIYSYWYRKNKRTFAEIRS